MVLSFCVDKLVDGKPYPNAAVWQAQPYTPEWRKFSVNWPYSEPVHFFEYLDRCRIPYKIVQWTQADRNTFYPISLSFFDFGIDWFATIRPEIKEKLRADGLTLWFFYSEGDNPKRIYEHLLKQAEQHTIKPERIRFTSANSMADSLENFSYFVDDECLYQLRNTDAPVDFHTQPRDKKFTMLVRTHKWWRATTMARFWSQGLHKQGYFSYNNALGVDDQENDNPIEIDSFENLRNNTYEFLNQCPFVADSLSPDQHNLYATTVEEHFGNSYLNVILETHLDVDQSNGVFLTEKTFKPIKHSQPFIIFGAAGSIAQLRAMGYRTFDHVINHNYDSIADNTQRWDAACREFEHLMTCDLHQLYLACEGDLRHNQQLFLASKEARVNSLLERITHATIS
jgi:hypothetical protein